MSSSTSLIVTAIFSSVDTEVNSHAETVCGPGTHTVGQSSSAMNYRQVQFQFCVFLTLNPYKCLQRKDVICLDFFSLTLQRNKVLFPTSCPDLISECFIIYKERRSNRIESHT